MMRIPFSTAAALASARPFLQARKPMSSLRLRKAARCPLSGGDEKIMRAGRAPIRLTMLLLLSALAPTPLASTQLIFPRLSNQPGEVTGIAIVNLGTSNAQVTLTARRENGTELGTLVSPMIAPGAQFVSLGSDFPALSGNPGWVEAVSDSDDLTGFFLFLDAVENTQLFDGADLPPLSDALVFHDVRTDGAFSTEINVVNPSQQLPAPTRFDLFGPDGALLSTKNLSIPSKGVFRTDAEAFFGQKVDDASILVTSLNAALPLAGFESVRDNADFRGSTARPASEKFQILYFPQLAVGPVGNNEDIRTEVGITNYSAASISITVAAHRPDGSTYDTGSGEVAVNSIARNLSPHGSTRVRLQDFGFNPAELKLGWIRVEANTTAINGFVAYDTTTGNRATVSSVDRPRSRAIFSQLATTDEFLTGVSLLNPGANPATVQVVAVRQDGTYIGERQMILLPGQRVADLISNAPGAVAGGLIPQATGEAGGLIWVNSNYPLYMSTLFIRTKSDGGILYANVPPQPAPSLFKPANAMSPLEVAPLIGNVQVTQMQLFAAAAPGSPVTWSVPGMNLGSIQAQTGLYTAPAMQPDQLPVSIVAAAGGRAGSAAADVLDPIELSDVGFVQAMTYLEGQQRIYTLERVVAGAKTRQATTDDSQIFSRPVPGGNPSAFMLAQFNNQIVIDLLPFVDDDGGEWLLLLNNTQGSLLILPPDSSTPFTVPNRSFTSPLAMTFESDGSLSVRESTGNTVFVARGELLAALPKNKASGDAGRVRARRGSEGAHEWTIRPEFATVAAPGGPVPRISARGDGVLAGESGYARDACTGDTYLSFPADNAVVQIEAATSEEVALPFQFNGPTSLLALYRREVACPQAFHLLISEPSAKRIQSYNPAAGTLTPFLQNAVADTLAFVPGDTALSDGGVILYGQAGTAASSAFSTFSSSSDITLRGSTSTAEPGALFAVDVPNLYTRQPVNMTAACPQNIPFTDPNLRTAVAFALGLNDVQAPIPCSLATQITQLNAQQFQISQLDGIEFLVNLRILLLRNNTIGDLTPLAGLTALEQLDLRNNFINDVGPLGNLPQLQVLDVTNNNISSFDALAGLPSLTTLTIALNNITDVSPLNDLRQLQVLDVGFNPLAGQIGPLQFLTQLTQLSIAATQTTSLNALAGLPSLMALTIAVNNITNLSPLSNLRQLQILEAQFNPLGGQIGPLQFLTQIRQLNIAATGTTSLAPLVTNQGLGVGDQLDIRQNPLDSSACPDLFTLLERGVNVSSDLDNICGM